MTYGKVLSALTASLILFVLSGCGKTTQSPSNATSTKRTVGRAMVREAPSQELYLRPGAGGVSPDGKLVLASSVRFHKKAKRPVDACGNEITPDFNSADLNDDQRALKNLISQLERQLNNERHTQYVANNPGLKNVAKDMAHMNKMEIERLKRLQRHLCKEAAHTIAVRRKIAHAWKKD